MSIIHPPVHAYRLARLPEDQPARCELSELLVRECAHCQDVPDPEVEIARHSYEVAARQAGGAR
jgi:hypothetical protein